MDRKQLEDQLILHEGFRSKPYTDTVGKLTIGVGRNLDDVGISETEARALLNHDIATAEKTAARIVPSYQDLDEVRQRVLVDMAFNMGRKLAQFMNALAAIDARDFDTAAAEMLDSRWARQVGRRATRLAKMMKTGQDQGP